MGCGTSFVKYVLFFFNLLVALLGLAIIGVGVAVMLNWKAVTNELKSHLTVAPWIFIVIGSITFIIAFFGCCGAIRESHCMVVTYAIFLLVIIIVQVVIAVLMFTYGDTLKTNLRSTVDNVFRQRQSSDVDKGTELLVDSLQQQFSCCGGKSPVEYGLSRPLSCCPRDVGNALTSALGVECNPTNAYSVGCVEAISDLFQKWNKPIAGIAIGIACVEIVGALFALCLANSIRNMDRRSRY